MKKIALYCIVVVVALIGIYKYVKFNNDTKPLDKAIVSNIFSKPIEIYFYLNNKFPESFDDIEPYITDIQSSSLDDFTFYLTSKQDGSIYIYEDGFNNQINESETYNYSKDHYNFRNYLFNMKGDFLIYQKECSRDKFIDELKSFILLFEDEITQEKEVISCLKDELLSVKTLYFKRKFNIEILDSVFLLPNAYKTIITMDKNDIIDLKGNYNNETKDLLENHLKKCLDDGYKVILPVNLPIKRDEFIYTLSNPDLRKH